ncbi:hypothetical protein BaRGS_00006707, partial [Batillaria attramentaria]
NEENLLECENPGWRQFNDTACNGVDGAYAGVMCFPNGELSLYNGTWRKVCGSAFDHTDATVVCRELGFNHSAILTPAMYHAG